MRHIGMLIRLFFAHGLGLMALAALFFAFTDVLIKFVSPLLTTIEIAFFRFLIGGIILWPLISSTRTSLKGNHSWILLARGLSGFLCFFFFLKSIAMIPVANAVVLAYTFPMFTALFSFLLFKEPVRAKEIILIGVGLIGIYVLIDPRSEFNNMGCIFGLLAGFFSGLTVVLIRKLRETNGPLIISFYYSLVGATLSFPFFVKGFRMPNLQQILLLILISLIFLGAQLLMTQGFKSCKALGGSVILMSEVVFVAIAGIVIFKDSISTRFLTGAFLVVGSGVGLNLIGRRSRVMHARSHETADEKTPRSF